ncbi:MAG: hypothetical protein ACOZCO_07885 [Bacteroidota bacterium]
MSRIFLTSLISFFIFSCGPKPQKGIEVHRSLESCIIEKFFSEEESDFGKYHIGMTRTAFQDISNTGHLIQNEDEVIDSISLCGNEKAWCEASFIFYEGRLTDITAAFFIDEEKNVTVIFPLITEKLNEKYGPGVSEQGTMVWPTERNNKPYIVYLSDESIFYRRPVIKLMLVGEGKVGV